MSENDDFFDQFDTSTYRLYRLIKDVFVLMDYGDRYILADFDLTALQYRLLTLLYFENEQRLVTLAERTLVARSTITRTIDQMESAHLVERIDDPGDRRAQQVKLTPAGIATLKQVTEAHQAALRDRFACLAGPEEHSFINSLEKLRSILRTRLDELEAERR